MSTMYEFVYECLREGEREGAGEEHVRYEGDP